MKTISLILIGIFLLTFSNKGQCNENADGQISNSESNTLIIKSSPELKSLIADWANEYVRINPGLQIVIGEIPSNQSIGSSNLGFISGENPGAIPDQTSWKMTVGRDAIVPIINARNPMLAEIYRQGVSTVKLTQLLSDPQKQNWEYILSGGKNSPANCYMIDNKAIKTAFSNFAKMNSATHTTVVANQEELLSAIQKDVYAIGFCRLTDVRDAKTGDLNSNIKLLPMDRNKNGRIDHFENIYDNLDAFTRGVWIGKYPVELCGHIYAISSTKPTDYNAINFLAWINAEGQKYLNANGYSNLVSSEKQANIHALNSPETLSAENEKPITSRIWVFVLLAFFAIGILTVTVVKAIFNKASNDPFDEIDITPAFDENTILAPKGLYFDKSHTWAFMEPDGNVKIGLDDFMQHVTGKLTRVKLRETGEKVRKGEKILTIIRNGKQLNISSPISGTIKEQNQSLTGNSSILNSKPYSEGWVYRIEPKNWLREIQFLFMAEKYKEWLQDEFIRLKDFLANSVRSNKNVYEHIILQDGGELTDQVLADLGPEVWEDFQTKFIDASK